MESKKISFGFSKPKRRNLIFTSDPVTASKNKVELIKCVEGQEIKLVEEKQEELPLVIPMKENNKTSAALASLMTRRAVLLGEEVGSNEDLYRFSLDVTENPNAINHENIEQQAARELLADLQTKSVKAGNSQLVLPVPKPNEIPLEGAKESTLVDYEYIPIQKFGAAMLRGMGWVEEPKSKDGPSVGERIFLRPKGMGLGADKALKVKQLLVKPESNEILEIKKEAYVRIVGGKHKDLYGQIEGFDDEAGRIIIKMAIGGSTEAFNEFLCQPVSKNEYVQYGKCINTAKYEQYKKMENENRQIIIRKEIKEEQPRKKEFNKFSSDYKLKSKEGKCHELREDYNNFFNKDNYYERRDKEYIRKRHNDKKNDEKTNRASCSNHCHPKFSNESKTKKSEQPHKLHRQSRSRSREHKDFKSHSRSSHRNRCESSDDDTGESSKSESDSDSAYEQRSKKGVSKKSRLKQKSRKAQRSKSVKKKNCYSTYSSDTSTSSSKEERHRKSHKKKTKKSKKQRCRTKSRSRSKGRK